MTIRNQQLSRKICFRDQLAGANTILHLDYPILHYNVLRYLFRRMSIRFTPLANFVEDRTLAYLLGETEGIEGSFKTREMRPSESALHTDRLFVVMRPSSYRSGAWYSILFHQGLT
jgi:hypothetical protein